MSSPGVLSCRNLTEYLKTLSDETLRSLYNHPATCLVVFRDLPPLGKLFVMRLLHVSQAVPQAVVSSWVVSAQWRKAEAAIKALSELRIWSESSMSGGLPAWSLQNVFRINLKTALFGGGAPWSMSSSTNLLEPDPNRRDVPFLDTYASERWDTVLHYMVGSSQQEGISADAVRILLHSNLMRLSEEDGPIITRTGFQFLLMETPSQVWYFILQYLDTVHARGMDVTECLKLLFQLSFATLGKDYSTANFSQSLLMFLQHLREFGLVYQRKRTSGRFYPTRLVLNIALGEQKAELEKKREGYLVVETNYRIYAYSSSNLQVALIGLFSELLYRFPNLTVALISRDSIRQALRAGITADQIIRYLKMHIVPKSEIKNSSLPPTVVDQIRLWEEERNRFTFTEGVLYNQFLSHADFELVKNYAENLGVCVWSNNQNRTVVVTKDGHDDVKRFWKRHSRGS